MKKLNKTGKQLLLSTEKVRALQLLTNEHLRDVVGGTRGDGDSDCGGTRMTSNR